jgi:hypothetical protein
MARNRPVRDIPDLKPEMKGKAPAPPKMPAGSLRHARGTAVRIGSSARSGRLSMQRTVVKVSYHPVGGVRGLVRYASHEGPDREGNEQEPVTAFSADQDEVDGRVVTSFWIARNDPRYFHVINSPEHGDRIEDMKAGVRAGMEQIQKDLGTRVEWIAYQHDRDEDAQGRHVHILIPGVDRNGDELLIAPEYVRDGFRYRFSEEVTKEIGPRSEREIRDGLDRSEQLREHREHKDKVIQQAVEKGAINSYQAKAFNRQYARSGTDAERQQVVERVQATMQRDRNPEPEMTP